MNIAELAIRGTSVMFDIQMSALRSIWHIQARSAAALGAPDCSDLVHFADTGTKRLISTIAEQLLTSAHQAREAITEMQTQFGRIVEQGTMQLTEEIRDGIEELSQRTQEGLQAVKEIALQGAVESERAMQQGLCESGGGQQRGQDPDMDDEQRFGAQQSQSPRRQDNTEEGPRRAGTPMGASQSHDDSQSGRRQRNVKRGGQNKGRQTRGSASSANRAGRRR